MTAFRAMRGHHATYEQAPLPIGVTLVAMMMVLILAFFAVAPDEEPRLGGCPYINVMRNTETNNPFA